MLVGVVLASFFRVVTSVRHVAVCCMGMMRAFLMISSFVMFSGFAMVARSMVVMLGRLGVML